MIEVLEEEGEIMSLNFEIANRMIGNGEPCFIIAEVAQAHDGSLGMAHAFIDAIASTGADAVKFQTHIAEAESSIDDPWRVKFSLQDKRRYDYWKRMEFTEQQWKGLNEHAAKSGLVFLSSPFSIEAVELLKRTGVFAWKIASGEVSNTSMLEYIAETGLPILLSTGMSQLGEIDDAVERIKAKGLPLAVLQCSSSYPTPPERAGLNLIRFFRKRYGCLVGLSDHSGTIYPALSAVTLGAAIIEVHVTMSRQMFGPDVSASVTIAELEQLVEGTRFIEKMLANPVDKDVIAKELAPMRQLFMKSVVARVDLRAGTTLKAEFLTVKKPGTGIPANRLQELIGLRVRRDIKENDTLHEEDLEKMAEGTE
jgi:N-acetylneuraminate synthase